MKTSNKLLLSALIIFVISLGIYNSALRAEFLTGNFKNPYRNYHPKNVNYFNEVEINAASQLDVSIVPGQGKVYVSKWSGNVVKITQQGKRLIVNVVYLKDDNKNGGSIIIECPALVSVKAKAFFTDEGKLITHNNLNSNNDDRHITVKGFKQDSLLIEADNASSIGLVGNKLGSLNAILGFTPGAASSLSIEQSNTIQKSNLQVRQKGRLEVENINIPQLKYHFADSAEVSFTGVATKSLNKN
ncbi:hypothetical protein BDD43_3847 [Mucilaginibacter gracilis]|uniref:Uncharacterized protein n=1 Tax=Mucilaginibacter gracilis TaxID=423350 RepID=A0A495J3S8_9SPHI|nr:hypothetical protein [Mucilaginibacter gracilis]RKR83636.1 hypothetical protein BDD43_3847 [Mucilaginibacter gracilis]